LSSWIIIFNTSQETGWEKRLRNDLFCVKQHVKHYSKSPGWALVENSPAAAKHGATRWLYYDWCCSPDCRSVVSPCVMYRKSAALSSIRCIRFWRLEVVTSALSSTNTQSRQWRRHTRVFRLCPR